MRIVAVPGGAANGYSVAMEHAAAPAHADDAMIDPLAPRPMITAIQVLLLIVLAAGCLVRAMPSEFTADSARIASTHPQLAAEAPWSALWQATTWGNGHRDPSFRPLTMASYRLEIGLLGLDRDDPTHYAVVNVLLHVLAVLLLYRLARPYLLSRQAAFLAAALFAAHPVVAMTAPYLPGRAILLATVFVLACLLAWENFRRTAQLHWSWAAAGCWVLAGLSHESSWAIAGMVLARELAMEPRRYRLRREEWVRASIPGYLALIAGGLIWVALRAVMINRADVVASSPLDNVLAQTSGASFYYTAVALVRDYVLHAAVPLGLSHDYGFAHVEPVTTAESMGFRIGAALIAGLAIAATILYEYRKSAAMGLLMFVAALLPATNLLALTGSHLADRYLYLPLVGLSIAAASLLAWAGGWDRPGTSLLRKIPPAVVGVAAVAALSVFTWRLAPVWQNNLALWGHAVAQAPDSVRARTELAIAMDAGDQTPELIAASMEHAARAVALSADLSPMTYPEARLTLAAQHLALGRSLMQGAMVTRAAGRELRQAAKLLEEIVTAARQEAMLSAIPTDNPTGLPGARAPRMLVTIYTLLKNWPEASRAYTLLLTIEPDDAEAQASMGQIAVLLGRLDDAQRHMMRALQLQPNHPEWREVLAEVLVARGRFDDALVTLAAPDIDTMSPRVREVLEKAYIGLIQRYVAADRRGEAEDAAREAVQRYGISGELMQKALNEAFEARRKVLTGQS